MAPLAKEFLVLAFHLLEVVVVGEGRAAFHLLRIYWPAAGPFPWARSALASSLRLALFFARLSASLRCGVCWSASSSFSWARSSLASSLFGAGALCSLLLSQLLCLFFFPAFLVVAPASASAASFADAAPLAGRHGGNGG